MGMLNGGIMPEVVEKTLADPLVRVDFLDGSDVYVIGLTRVWLDATYHVRGCVHWQGTGQPDRTEVNAIGAQLDVLLHNHEAATASLQVHSFREEPTPSPAQFEQNGELWLQSGGVYRIRAHAL